LIKAGQSLGSSPGYSDDPANASAEHGRRFLTIIAREVAKFLIDFSRT
jgi:hypothetical protein